MIDFPEAVKSVTRLLQEGETCYLVGGAVRDMLLGRTLKDFDFSCDFDPRILARRMADRLDSAFYVMDEERLTSRVILYHGTPDPVIMDFSMMQGPLEHDLEKRDFTINAMAVDVRNPEKVLDPQKGGRDLQEKRLRTCSPTSFLDDPVRVIRAARYAVGLHLRMEPGTSQALIEASCLLETVSSERKRDELFKILDSSCAFQAILLLHKLGILKILSCEPDDERLGQFRTYEMLQGLLVPGTQRKDSEYYLAATFQSAIQPIRTQISDLMTGRNSNGHSRFQLDKFMLIGAGESGKPSHIAGLPAVFSNDELSFMFQFCQHENTAITLLTKSEQISRREAYQFYSQTGESGVDLILLGLAMLASKPAAEINQDKWMDSINRAAWLLDAWFNNPEISRPQPLLNGDEIMAELDLQPGKIVGRLLDEMKEAQAAGEIKERQFALSWLRQKYQLLKEL